MEGVQHPERRRAPRFPVDIPIDLRCRGVAFLARTRDVSAEGMAAEVVGDAAIGAGDELTFSLMLQHVHEAGASLLEGSATVVRVHPAGERLLVAFRARCLSLLPTVAGIPGACPSRG